MVISYEKFGKYQERWVAVDLKTDEILTSSVDIGSVYKSVEGRLDKKIVKKNQKIVLKYIHRFDTRLAPSANRVSID